MQNNGYNGNGYYDLNLIKAIPILDVCYQLGIQVEKKGDRYWCKLRNERTASVRLNTHESPNSYVDFGGSNRKSDVIQFVCEALNISRGDSIKYLANAFSIPSERMDYHSTDLAIWEYEKIGMYGDLATKNFTFDLERQSVERVAELSSKYDMPMSDLRKKHPKIYEQLLRDKAVPFVRDLRNDYYLGLLQLHLMKIDNLPSHPDLFKSLTDEIQALQNAERLLQKAAVKTSLKTFGIGVYDPVEDLKKLLAGEIKPSIGNRSYNQMQSAAKMLNCSVKYRTIPWEKFTFHGLSRFQHSAFFKGDKVVIGYLESDHNEIKPIFDKMMGRENLSSKIATAEKKRQETGQINRTKPSRTAER